jgi:choline monooxygenase
MTRPSSLNTGATMTQTLVRELKQFNARLPLSRAHTIPSRWYRDATIATAEQLAVFGETWQLVARVDQLASPGSFVTSNVAGEPLLLVRDERGVLRAFFNVCRHRAACVVTQPEGTAPRLRCRYHGWTYDLSGRLRGAPEFDGVDDFQREDNGLTPLAVDSWGPLVFVNLAQRAVPLAHILTPLPERLGKLAGLHFVERRNYEIACNWKVFVDNYLDGGYHVNTVHPSLAGVLQYSEYQTECFGFSSLQTSPLRRPDPLHADATAAAVRVGETASYGWVFPNFMVNLYAGAMDTNVVFPLGPERCAVSIDFYVAPNGAPSLDFAADSVKVGHRIQLEDVGVCEDVQRGLNSRSYDTGRYSVRRELGVFHFHKLLASKLLASSTRRADEKPRGAKVRGPQRAVGPPGVHAKGR